MSIVSSHIRALATRAYDLLQRLYSEAPYRWSASGGAFPAWHYYLEVTRRCNLRCRMCQYISFLEQATTAEQRSGELTTGEWKRVIDQTGRFSLLTFTGGEPLLRDDFFELLAYASRRSRVHYITNATLLRDEAVESSIALAPRRLGGRGLNFVGVSLEGPAELHDHIRRQQDAFEKATLGMKRLRARRDETGRQCPLIHVTTVIQQANVDALKHMPRIVAEAGGDTLNLVTETRMHDVDGLGERPPRQWRASDIEWPRIEPDTLRAALDDTEIAAREAGIELRLPRMPRAELARYYDDALDLRAFGCRSLWNTLFIGRKGEVYPCWLLKIGNVRENTLRELWNGEEMRAFRRSCRNGLFALCPGCCFIEYEGRRRGKGKGELS